MKDYYEIMVKNKGVQLLIVFIVLDVIFGVLRAIKEKKLNSTIGIDGIIRKVGMIITISVCLFVDCIVSIDLIGFIPGNIKTVLGLSKVGISIIFNSLYIIFEILSIFKNMYRCKLPLPKKLKVYLEKLLKEFTCEIKESE